MKAFKVKPVVTEKTASLQQENMYSFYVSRDINKIEFKQFIESTYKVEVVNISSSIVPSKKRLIGRGRVLTKRPLKKKMTVKLKEGQTIEMAN